MLHCPTRSQVALQLQVTHLSALSARPLAAVRHNFRRWLPGLALLVLAAGTLIVARQLDEGDLRQPGTRLDNPDFYMQNFVSTVMGMDGLADRTLKAKRLEHFPKTNEKELTEPYLVLYQTGAPAWHVRSESGWISPSGDVVLLRGRVHAWRVSKTGVKLVDIHTRDLRILPGTDYGETDKPVTIATADHRTVGLGMRAFLAESRIELMSQVKTNLTGHLQ
jgi:lipopolysaccharide export system protein LptC